ncbi:cytochrome c oxidase assembly protein [Luteococcus sediminum]
MLHTTQFAVDLLVWIAAAVTMGAWTTAAFIRPRRGPQRERLVGDRLLGLARLSGLIGAGASAVMAVLSRDLSGGYSHGESMGWCVAVGFGLASTLLTFWKHWESALYALLLQSVALVAPIAATERRVPLNHDLTGDTRMIAAVCFTLLAGTWACRLFLSADDARDRIVCFRMRLLSCVLAVTTVMADVVTAAALPGPLTDEDASWHLARAGAALVIGALCWWSSSAAASLAMAVIGMMGQFAAASAFRAVPTENPRLAVDVAAIGYSVADWPTLVNLVVKWRINPFFLCLAVAAVASYLWLVHRVHQQGKHWPAGRTAAWVIGWVIVVLLTSSGVGRYAPVVFSVHMFMNLGLNMLAAMVLVLGGYLTLVLQAVPPRGEQHSAGVHEWVQTFMRSRLVALLHHPLIALVFMTGTYYVFYLTSLFTRSLEVHWLHQLFYLHFLVSGCIFYGLIIGVDQPVHPLPHLGRLGLIIGAMPFHAFFGVILMSKTSVYAEDFLNSIGHPWMAARGLAHDQWVGGTIAWAGGEFPLAVALGALFVQWARQDKKESDSFDQGIDSGDDESLDAYNQMLTQLAERDRRG